MKIIISNTELTRIQVTLKNLDINLYNELSNGLKLTNAIECRLLSETVEVTVKAEYIKDVCDLYQQYLGMIICNIKATMMACELFAKGANVIDQKYEVTSSEKSDEHVGA